MAVSAVLVNVFNGLGMGFRSLLLTLTYVILIVMPLAYLGSRLFDLSGLWGGMAAGQFISCVLGFFWVRKVTRGLA
jgi:Na+-driven multidrug efflux pump